MTIKLEIKNFLPTTHSPYTRKQNAIIEPILADGRENQFYRNGDCYCKAMVLRRAKQKREFEKKKMNYNSKNKNC